MIHDDVGQAAAEHEERQDAADQRGAGDAPAAEPPERGAHPGGPSRSAMRRATSSRRSASRQSTHVAAGGAEVAAHEVEGAAPHRAVERADLAQHAGDRVVALGHRHDRGDM